MVEENVLRPWAERVLADAKRLAPVDTGHLRDSLKIEYGDDGTASILTDVEYAGYVEHGTRYQPAQPFLRPALMANPQPRPGDAA